ncbi:hypothetical protein E2320_003215 [Naja naja]|nr:hypothetical protein E2320_003215 [Naja naja]
MELQRHPKSIRDPHKLSETLDCLQESKSNVGQHIKLNLGVEGEDVHSSPPKLSRPPEPSPSGTLVQSLNGLPGADRRVHAQGLPYTVLVEEVWGQQGALKGVGVGEPCARYTAALCACEHSSTYLTCNATALLTQKASPTSVEHVAKLSSALLTWSAISTPIQAGSHISAPSVSAVSVTLGSSPITSGCTLASGPTSVKRATCASGNATPSRGISAGSIACSSSPRHEDCLHVSFLPISGADAGD